MSPAAAAALPSSSRASSRRSSFCNAASAGRGSGWGGAPPLALSHLKFRLRNEDYEHQFGLSARPPASLGSALEVRAELTGASVRQIQSWSGRVFAELGTTDLAAALMSARDQLSRSSARRKIAVLLSDCRATVDGDPVAAAAGIDELVIVAPESDSAEAEELARATGARITTVAGPSDAGAALARVLDA